MNLLFHIVGSENIGRASELKEESILEPKHGARPDDGGFRKDQTGIFLSSSLILAGSKSVRISTAIASLILVQQTLVRLYSEGEFRSAL